MPDLGLNVLLKGKNMARLLGGLWVALRVVPKNTRNSSTICGIMRMISR